MSKKSKMSNDIFEIMFKKKIDAFDSISKTNSHAFNKLKPINIQYINQVNIIFLFDIFNQIFEISY